MNMDTKFFLKVLANRILQHVKRIIHDQLCIFLGIQGSFNI